MATLGEIFQGTPPTYGVNVVGGGKSPLFDFAKIFGNYLKGLIGQPLPSYPGQIDPGMSPTMAGLGQMLQGYSQSPLPQVLGQAGGVLGRFMNPSFANPVARMQFGFPNYFGGQQPGPSTSGPTTSAGGPLPPMGMPPGQTPGFPGMPFPSTPPPPPGGGMTVSPSMPPSPWAPGTGFGGPPPMGGNDMNPNLIGGGIPYGNDMQPRPMDGGSDMMRNMFMPDVMNEPGGPYFGPPPPPPGGGMRNMTGGPYIAPPTSPLKNMYMPKGKRGGQQKPKGKRNLTERMTNKTADLRHGSGIDFGDGVFRRSVPYGLRDYGHGNLFGNPG